MGHPIRTSRTWRHRPRPVGRTRYRPWARPNEPRYSEELLSRIPSMPRATLARLAMLMIDRMDEIDGDADLEDLREDYENGHDAENEEEHD